MKLSFFNEYSFDFRIKTNIKNHRISVEIVDFVPIGNKYLSQGKKEVNLNWPDWIDSWAIDFNYNSSSKCFFVDWYSFRNKDNKGTPAISTAALPDIVFMLLFL